MISKPHHISLLAKRLGISLLIFSICRVLFFLFNYSLFEQVNLLLFIKALRFDLSAIFYLNAIFILLHIIPLSSRNSYPFQLIKKSLFHLSNSTAIVLNCIDIEYFKYTGKRTTSDLFSFLKLGTDIQNLIPQFLKDFWYIIVFILLLIVLSEYLYRKTSITFKNKVPFSLKKLSLEIIIAITVMGISIVLMRGGTQLKPLRINSAALYASEKNISLILNTPFTIIKTLNSEQLNELNYFEEAVLKNYFTPIKAHKPFRNDSTKLNVVIIIMESFSKEFIGALSGNNTHTPFLDSLMQHGLLCKNAYSNGKKSIEGLPSIISSTPSLMNSPFTTSRYAENSLSNLPTLVKKLGYSTSFFHGGTNGTMGFDSYCKIAGFDSYYGKNEYPVKTDYDGNWGIFDEPFFSFFCDKISESKQPFFTSIFSLSSHHPYTIPEKYKNSFGANGNNLPSSISYSDFALKQFFNKAKSKDWFNNTLFVITADHTGISESPFFSNSLGVFQIPILFYKPDNSLKGIITTPVQQIDIMPSILHYLGYTEKFFSFGESIFDTTTKHFAVNFINDKYQYITDDHVLYATTDNPISLYKYSSDSLLKNNLINSDIATTDSMYSFLKAFIQTYNYSLIHNKQTLR